MEEVNLHICRNCGPKEPYLFSPAELKRTRGLCRKCASDANKRRYPINVPPTDYGYGFKEFGLGKK